MPRFDTTAKHLIQGGPRDWLTLAGLPVPASAEAVQIVDAELSTVSTASDKLLRVDAPVPYLAHVEFQASADPDLDGRILVYNVLARWRHRLPVRSVCYLLRREAATGRLMGGVRETLAERARIEFDYQLVRVWDLSVDTILAGGVGTLPLAAVAAVDRSDLPGVVERVRTRLSAEVTRPQARELLLATRILLGLRYDRAFARTLLKGAMDMEESTTYMEIIEIGERRGRAKGKAEGLVEGERRLLVRRATKKFGPPPAAALATLGAVTDPAQLERLDDELQVADSWEAWLAHS